MKVYDRTFEAVDLWTKKYWPQFLLLIKKITPKALSKRLGYTDDEYAALISKLKRGYDQLVVSVFHPVENWQATRAYLVRLQPKRVATKMGLDDEQYEKIVEVIAHPKKHWPETKNNIIHFNPRNWSAADGDRKIDFEHFVHGVIEPVKQKAVSIRHHKMPVDVVNFGDRYVLSADLPGHSKDEIDISAEGHFVTIAVQASTSSDSARKEEGEYIMHERKNGTVTRIIELPRPIELDTIKGLYVDGVVRIEVVKQEVENHSTVHVSL